MHDAESDDIAMPEIKNEHDNSNETTIDWQEDDSEHPRNWKTGRKWIQVVLLTLLTFMVQYGGSAYSSTETDIARDFDTSHELAIAGISVLLLAYAVVPMLLAPLAEVIGRVPLYLVGYFGFLCFTIPSAVTTDISVMIIFRFLAGCAGSVGNTMIGGSITDMFEPAALGAPMTFYIVFGLLLSEPMGPLINGFVVENPRLGYRWVFWFQIIFGFAILLVLFLKLEETRPSVLLQRRAAKMSKEKGTKMSAKGDDTPMSETIYSSLKMPWLLMFTDVTVALFSLWLAFAWGLAYGMLQSISLVFKTNHAFSESQVGLVFVALIAALAVGLVAAAIQELWFKRSNHKAGSFVPEGRLQIACIGSVCLSGGLFFYAWTSGRMVAAIVPMVAIGIVFFGIFTIYYAVFLYICDNYSDLASSALSAAGFWRNMFAAAFPLFIEIMYNRLGYQWAGSTLAFISVPLGLIPFALVKFGPKVRANSKYIES
ncbi:protein of unknown function [Taphrina deformans PYCC 5710]|uniref:Major facilitator superfamily (MFS) profile domain-containing protein n=1 Tax=Taphrina deformans (strain PYCC 5710 / ATCC 11124 / CBS 356.35 / IMI 108563 / JCM 9778 / NBRC 8474) TaxID=1097556 RepID=R4XGN9_TAPDE|nr:protein of unknown function [Taphrina deformans PYCC 5710]|eukprot:CCG85062.1 protein of unknown function [Taphrina deformans PYCC 5710]